MNLTRGEVKILGRLRERPTPGPGELFAIFAHGKLVNPKNAGIGWQMKAWPRYKREWRHRVAQALLETIGRRRIDAAAPKRVTFLAFTRNEMDTDGLELSLAAVRDELVKCGVLSGDAPRDHHQFVYDQRIDRVRRGVEIRVAPKSDVMTEGG